MNHRLRRLTQINKEIEGRLPLLCCSFFGGDRDSCEIWGVAPHLRSSAQSAVHEMGDSGESQSERFPGVSRAVSCHRSPEGFGVGRAYGECLVALGLLCPNRFGLCNSECLG